MKMQKTNKWILIYGVIAALLIALHYVLQLSVFEVWNEYVPFLEKLSMSLFLIALIFMVSKIIRKLINTRAHLEGDRYNLLRITRLLAIVSSLIVATSFLFQNLYAAVVSFGLISLIIGFALQAPITSFIAWIYLIFRRPYLVGDRIQINGLRGDVVEINYLDTTMLECSGD